MEASNPPPECNIPVKPETVDVETGDVDFSEQFLEETFI